MPRETELAVGSLLYPTCASNKENNEHLSVNIAVKEKKLKAPTIDLCHSRRKVTQAYTFFTHFQDAAFVEFPCSLR